MKKVFISVPILLLVLLLWYLFIKPQDYQVSFKAKAIPGTIYETVKAWNMGFDSVVPLQFESPTHFEQTIVVNDSVHVYEWNITPIHDSLSQVKVNIKDPEHTLKNKVSVPFSDTNLEKGARKTLIQFNGFLNDHLKDFKVSIVGEAELFSSFCACVALNTTPENKARGMMANYSLLNSFLVDNGVTLNGLPFVEVENWDLKANMLTYNFCYPILRSEKLPNHPDIAYKRIFSKKTLKAIYNGNYITSDRAWYALLDYAQKNNIDVENKPIEVFYNNPNMGGNELNWKTEVYMPLKESK
ncbi:AraC family transcriptional regulator [Flagellimonas taeanensis]|uniref:GyrI-like domain-containing protein n=1 Tax=Flavobacteriaceae TaxID=49546 RepID=UPI000E6885CF|nr:MULTISPECIES: GyrI-like domain-containing protein [Allomuricauda]MDC6385077.1 AraC family transcriptional regulator [Muricauda sp. SK9]RIV48957.1 AraC family transcriptional regulator [Allomuricauda taeanensis]